jgi:zinc transport system substrate-binding protein
MGEHDDHEEHGNDDESILDPHAWLNPQVAMVWTRHIAFALRILDPENEAAYLANANATVERLVKLDQDITAQLADVARGGILVPHDAYQYFEMDFDFPASGAISISDASDPSPARIAEIQARIAEQGIDCVLAEPQFNSGLVATVLDGTEAQTGILDPLGSDLEPGPALYPQLIRNLSTALAGCM